MSAERGSGKRREWCWRSVTEKWNKEMIQTYSKGKDILIMVWGAIWVGGRSDLYIIDRDLTSKKGGYSSKSYIEVLENQLPTIYQPGMRFMQDNVGIHTAKKVKDWFSSYGIELLPWPPYSPDLNPIEHVWFLVRDYLNKHYLELSEMGKSDAAYQSFYDHLDEAWNAIPQETIDNLIKGVTKRLQHVVDAQGWHTKY
jgi:transposase